MATIKQKRAVDKLVGNGGNVTRAMLDVGYSENTANTPKKLTNSKGFQELLEEAMPDTLLTQKHKELLTSSYLDHMTFPPFNSGKEKKQNDNPGLTEKGEQLTDDDIIELLASVNCKVRRIVHGEQARHVYFWSSDNKSRKDALDMAFKLKGAYAPTKSDITTGGEKLPSTDLDALANAMAETLKQTKI